MSDIRFPFPVGSLVACSWSMTYCAQTAQGWDKVLDRNQPFILLSEVIKDKTANCARDKHLIEEVAVNLPDK